MYIEIFCQWYRTNVQVIRLHGNVYGSNEKNTINPYWIYYDRNIGQHQNGRSGKIIVSGKWRMNIGTSGPTLEFKSNRDQ